MAERDWSQGFAFIYVDVKELLKNNSSKIDQSFNFNKDPIKETRDDAVQRLKDNLDRLQSLHHKLHAALYELDTITNKKKKY